MAATPSPPPRRRSSCTSAPRMRAPRGADRVAHGDRAAVHVDLVLVHSQHAQRVDGHRGERLVDLEQVDVVDRQAGLLERLLGGVGGGAGQVGEVVGHRGLRRRSWPAAVLPLAFAHSSLDSTSAPAPSFTPGALPAVCEPSLPVRPGSLASDSSEEPRARRLVDLDHGVALLRADRDRGDLLGQAAVVGGGDGAVVALEGELVHVRARDLELVADLGGLHEHLLAGERVGQPVVDHRVEHLGVAHAVAEAGLGQHVRGLGHGLHAAGHGHVQVAGADGLVDDAGRRGCRTRRPCSRSRTRPPWGCRP